MANDWIKMRIDLSEEPEVIEMANTLQMDEDHVVGKLHRLWGWFDRKTTNGNAVGVTKSWLDRYLSVSGFADSLIGVGWLQETEEEGRSCLTMPGFDTHNGQSSKRRAVTANRVARHKGKSNAVGNAKGNAGSVTKSVPREEKRREEYKCPHPPARAREAGNAEGNAGSVTNLIQPGSKLDTPELQEAWQRFVEHVRNASGRSLGQPQAEVILLELSRRGPAKAVRDLEFSVRVGAKTLRDSDHDYEQSGKKPDAKAEQAKAQRSLQARLEAMES